MTVGLVYCSEIFCADASGKEGNSCSRARPAEFIKKHCDRIWLAEIVVGLTAFVLGLLSALSVVAIPAAAGYAMIGVGALVLALDIFAIVNAIRSDPNR